VRLFRHGSSVGQKEQARCADGPLAGLLRRRARRVRWRLALVAASASLTALNLVGLFFQEAGGLGFWLTFSAALLSALATGFFFVQLDIARRELWS
jgi:hypothetical protein